MLDYMCIAVISGVLMLKIFIFFQFKFKFYL